MRLTIRRGEVQIPTHTVPTVPPVPPTPVIESGLFRDLEIGQIFCTEPPPVEGEDTRYTYMKEGRSYAVEEYTESGFYPFSPYTVVYSPAELVIDEEDW